MINYLLILFVLFGGEEEPRVFRYQYVEFTNEVSCLDYKEKQREYLEDTLRLQFNKKQILYSETVCWTVEEWINYVESLQKVEVNYKEES